MISDRIIPIENAKFEVLVDCRAENLDVVSRLSRHAWFVEIYQVLNILNSNVGASASQREIKYASGTESACFPEVILPDVVVGDVIV